MFKVWSKSGQKQPGYLVGVLVLVVVVVLLLLPFVTVVRQSQILV